MEPSDAYGGQTPFNVFSFARSYETRHPGDKAKPLSKRMLYARRVVDKATWRTDKPPALAAQTGLDKSLTSHRDLNDHSARYRYLTSSGGDVAGTRRRNIGSSGR